MCSSITCWLRWTRIRMAASPLGPARTLTPSPVTTSASPVSPSAAPASNRKAAPAAKLTGLIVVSALSPSLPLSCA